MNTQLLLIDPQNDFCDLPEAWCPTDPASGLPTGADDSGLCTDALHGAASAPAPRPALATAAMVAAAAAASASAAGSACGSRAST